MECAPEGGLHTMTNYTLPPFRLPAPRRKRMSAAFDGGLVDPVGIDCVPRQRLWGKLR